MAYPANPPSSKPYVQPPMSAERKRAIGFTIATGAVILAGAGIFVALMAINHSTATESFKSLVERFTIAVTICAAITTAMFALSHFMAENDRKQRNKKNDIETSIAEQPISISTEK